MLPDFPVQKSKLKEIWTRFLYRRQQEYLGFWSSVPAQTHHEGASWSIERADGTSDRQEYKELGSVFSVDMQEVPNLTSDKLMEKLDAVAKDMAMQMSQGIFETLNETLGGGSLSCDIHKIFVD